MSMKGATLSTISQAAGAAAAKAAPQVRKDALAQWLYWGARSYRNPVLGWALENLLTPMGIACHYAYFDAASAQTDAFHVMELIGPSFSPEAVDPSGPYVQYIEAVTGAVHTYNKSEAVAFGKTEAADITLNSQCRAAIAPSNLNLEDLKISAEAFETFQDVLAGAYGLVMQFAEATLARVIDAQHSETFAQQLLAADIDGLCRAVVKDWLGVEIEAPKNAEEAPEPESGAEPEQVSEPLEAQEASKAQEANVPSAEDASAKTNLSEPAKPAEATQANEPTPAEPTEPAKASDADAMDADITHPVSQQRNTRAPMQVAKQQATAAKQTKHTPEETTPPENNTKHSEPSESAPAAAPPKDTQLPNANKAHKKDKDNVETAKEPAQAEQASTPSKDIKETKASKLPENKKDILKTDKAPTKATKAETTTNKAEAPAAAKDKSQAEPEAAQPKREATTNAPEPAETPAPKNRGSRAPALWGGQQDPSDDEPEEPLADVSLGSRAPMPLPKPLTEAPAPANTAKETPQTDDIKHMDNTQPPQDISTPHDISIGSRAPMPLPEIDPTGTTKQPPESSDTSSDNPSEAT